MTTRKRILPVPDKLLFLDFDGVLNTDSFRHTLAGGRKLREFCDMLVAEPHLGLDPEKVRLLNPLARQVSFVLASHWFPMVGESACEEALWKTGFEGRLLGVTPRKMSSDKGFEISMYLEECGIDRATAATDRFVILDDDVAYGLEKFQVRTDSKVGLTAGLVDEVGRRLGLTVGAP